MRKVFISLGVVGIVIAVGVTAILVRFPRADEQSASTRPVALHVFDARHAYALLATCRGGDCHGLQGRVGIRSDRGDWLWTSAPLPKELHESDSVPGLHPVGDVGVLLHPPTPGPNAGKGFVSGDYGRTWHQLQQKTFEAVPSGATVVDCLIDLVDRCGVLVMDPRTGEVGPLANQPSSEQIGGFQAPGSQRIWALEGTDAPRMKVSADAGRSWRTAELPGLTVRPGTTNSWKVLPVDPDHGYVAWSDSITTTIYYTSDGGATWRRTGSVSAKTLDPYYLAPLPGGKLGYPVLPQDSGGSARLDPTGWRVSENLGASFVNTTTMPGEPKPVFFVRRIAGGFVAPQSDPLRSTTAYVCTETGDWSLVAAPSR